MRTNLRTLAVLLGLAAAGSALAASDTLHAVLEDSKASGKGLNFYVNGQAIPGVVVSVDDRYLVARSQGQGTIVIRLDRLDGVAGFVTLPGVEKKAP
ncbi:MAG TPA: hypothetical protein VFF03_13785 [Rhodocyclaceae bacterium]|nr:hypothetical protein [Rhodocyclaceae bacterium]